MQNYDFAILLGKRIASTSIRAFEWACLHGFCLWICLNRYRKREPLRQQHNTLKEELICKVIFFNTRNNNPLVFTSWCLSEVQQLQQQQQQQQAILFGCLMTPTQWVHGMKSSFS